MGARVSKSKKYHVPATEGLDIPLEGTPPYEMMLGWVFIGVPGSLNGMNTQLMISYHCFL